MKNENTPYIYILLKDSIYSDLTYCIRKREIRIVKQQKSWGAVIFLRLNKVNKD